MPRLHAVLPVLTTAMLLALPGTAGATSICVPAFSATCPDDGSRVAQPSLEAALGQNATDGLADTVTVAAGTYTDPVTFETWGTDPLTIQGAGETDTILTSASNGNVFVVNLAAGARPTTMRDVGIRIPASFIDGQGAGIQVNTGALIERVTVQSLNPSSPAFASLIGTVTLRDVTVRGGAGGGKVTYAVATSSNTTQLTVEGLRVEAGATHGLYLSGGTVQATDVTVLAPTQNAVSLTAGSATVRNLLTTATSGTPISVFNTKASPITLLVEHATIVKAGAPAATAAFYVQTTSTGTADLHVRNSLASGFDAGYVRTGKAGGGAANLVLDWLRATNLDANSSGPGTATPAHTTVGAAGFRPGSYDLAADSLARDAGDPAPSSLATDRDGAPRVQDGDGDGVARRDLGALEAAPPVVEPDAGPTPGPTPAPTATADASPQPGSGGGPSTTAVQTPQPTPTAPPVMRPLVKDRTAPQTRIAKGPARLLARRRASFTFTASEPRARFECSLDGRRFSRCAARKTYTRLTVGRHVLRVRAVDPAGNRDRTPARVTFRVPR